MILEVFRVLEGVFIKHEDVARSGADEIDDEAEEPERYVSAS